MKYDLPELTRRAEPNRIAAINKDPGGLSLHNENSDNTGKLRQIIEGKLNRYYGRTLDNASEEEIFQAVPVPARQNF